MTPQELEQLQAKLIDCQNKLIVANAQAQAGRELYEKCKKLTPELQEDAEKALEALIREAQAGRELAEAVKAIPSSMLSLGGDSLRDAALEAYNQAIKE